MKVIYEIEFRMPTGMVSLFKEVETSALLPIGTAILGFGKIYRYEYDVDMSTEVLCYIEAPTLTKRTQSEVLNLITQGWQHERP